MPNAKNAPSVLLVVDTPPFLHIGKTIYSMMRDMVIALLPAVALSIYTYGLQPVRVLCLAMGTAVLTEVVCLAMQKRDIRIYDGSALVTGLLLACLLPVGSPWWLVMIGAMLSILLGKQVFGGLGANPLCPPLVGWGCLMLSWPMFMDASAMNLHSAFVDPLIRLKYFGGQGLPSETALLFGEQLGGLGSVYILALCIGGLYLIARQAIRWEVPVSFILGVLAVGGIFHMMDPVLYLAPELYLLTGSTVFAAFFVATDHPSSPVSMIGLFLFGFLAGALVVLIRIFGVYPDSAPFAVLLANLCTPLFDMIRPAPWGRRKAHA